MRGEGFAAFDVPWAPSKRHPNAHHIIDAASVCVSPLWANDCRALPEPLEEKSAANAAAKTCVAWEH